MNISIRNAVPSDAFELAKLKIDGWRASFSGIVDQTYLDAMSYEATTDSIKEILTKGKDRFHWHIAEDVHKRALGFCCGGPNRTHVSDYDGELWAIFVDKQSQRYGVGRKLFAATLSRLNEDGFDKMVVWCLTNNPFRTFYEKLGGKIVGDKMLKIGSQELQEYGYGFDGLRDPHGFTV